MILAVGVLCVLALGAASCSSDDDGIGVGTASRADVTELVDAPAAVTARAVATLTAPADGTLRSLQAPPGSTVSAGQVLAVIDSPGAQKRLADAEEALRALSGTGAVGVRDLSGTQRKTDEAAAQAFAVAREAAAKIADPGVRDALLAQVGAAEAAYREASASSRALIASVQNGIASVSQAMNALTAAQRAQAKSAYELARTTVDALTLRAPVGGVLQMGGPGAAGGGAGSIEELLGMGAPVPNAAPANGPGVDPAPVEGARVSAGTVILTVVDTSEPGLLAEVDETDVLLVSAGQAAEVELDAAPGARYAATVRAVDVLPTTSARGGVSYRVRLALRAGTFADGRAAPAPRPGMSAVAHLSVRSAAGAVVVPAAAVLSADGRDAVWVVRGGRAQRVPVTLGVAGTDLVQVVDGVAEGDRVVVRGADKVSAGQELK
ncbi:RND transporter [Virgisporangium aliadipatigenens]|uniref:RND transporter n=1 Tax=Virgisporangium aliadipatigenens TaxID=741659 RepID=A0A8J3YQH9_9ACTN|nr:RND transporter [Virgisporangium aliadipatigenens]